MDPSRIQLEDDRFGLIGVSFRPQNRATFLGMDDGDYVWSVGVVVGEEDEIQTVEIDEQGAKSSRMLTPGELFEGLQILGRPGSEAYLIVGALTLLGMDLRTNSDEAAHQFADVLRAAADDRSWRLPLHLIGQPRDLQLSSQGREILRQTASALEREGQARTSLAAAQRLELSASALDSIRRRIARKSLQAYRMHGRWYVVLDNLTRSRATEQNGTHAATSPSTPPASPAISPFEEMPESPVEAEPEPETAEPFVAVDEDAVETGDQAAVADERAITEADATTNEEGVSPTEEELAAFESEESPAEQPEATAPLTEVTSEQEELTAEVEAPVESESPEITDEMLESEAAAEEQAARDALAREAGLGAPPQAEDQAAQSDQVPVPDDIDQFLSESVMEQFIVAEIDTYIRELQPPDEELSDAFAETEPAESEPAAEAPEQESSVESEAVASVETPQAEPESEPQLEAEPPQEELVLAADEDAAQPAGVEAEAGTTEDLDSTEGELETATEESVDTVVGEPSAEPEAESVVSEMTKPVEEAEPDATATEPIAETTEPIDESAEPVAETTEPEESASTEPAPFDAESAQEIEEPVETEPDETVAEAAESEQNFEAEAPSADAAQPEEMFLSDETAAEAAESEWPTEDEEPVAEAAEAETRFESPGSEEPAVEEREEASSQLTAEEADLLKHLREEVTFLRQQGQEKDRQIVAWINGGQWLQPFVDQIHSLEQQVERLGDLQTKRDSDRITDLASERDRLRERLTQLETEITAARTADQSSQRSWFRRLMG